MLYYSEESKPYELKSELLNNLEAEFPSDQKTKNYETDRREAPKRMWDGIDVPQMRDIVSCRHLNRTSLLKRRDRREAPKRAANNPESLPE